MKHDETFDNNGEFDIAAYFAQLRLQYARSKAIEHKRYEARAGVSRTKGSHHTASLLNGSYARELGRFE